VRGFTLVNDHALKWLAIGLGKRLVEQGEMSLVLTIGLVGLSLPYVLFSWLAGSLADRHPKSAVIGWCKLAEVGIVAAAAAVVGFGITDAVGWMGLPLGLWLLLGTVMAIGVQAAIMTPAVVGAIPEVVAPARLAGANGVFRWAEAETALATSMSPKALDGLALDASHFSEDIHATREYRAQLCRVMAARAVNELLG
jgi:hypothetical protein